jgi:hypothetical protein
MAIKERALCITPTTGMANWPWYSFWWKKYMVNVHATLCSGASALHYASLEDHMAIVVETCQVRVDVTDNKGARALYYAHYKGPRATVLFLLEHLVY